MSAELSGNLSSGCGFECPFLIESFVFAVSFLRLSCRDHFANMGGNGVPHRSPSKSSTHTLSDRLSSKDIHEVTMKNCQKFSSRPQLDFQGALSKKIKKL